MAVNSLSFRAGRFPASAGGRRGNQARIIQLKRASLALLIGTGTACAIGAAALIAARIPVGFVFALVAGSACAWLVLGGDSGDAPGPEDIEPVELG